ncbi:MULTISPECIES: proline dehydrogenase family protein [Roseivirga]|jgi:proline dehydrogenase|uniref:Proline dehydrogenase n=1 Tax=Roseivirga thermotolerans TaxID=1758176 RepID=A0ABQ3I9Q4_9BACT|nr:MULTISPECIES: proline dehydrogenase family protein [Roseivirga]MEC7752695.1 proline dehydrogenase family protein [Bacteroidota bacterium]GHE66306.1 proline dehydrogenase [Roseivirga thermotolerans]|tara:strand:+ start:3159 stop:4370 length:1212 start_codon:yes stop_codon:yes gene_type:complete
MELKKFVDFDELEVAFRAKTDEALKKRHFIFSTMQWPWLVKLGTSLTKFALATGLPVKKLIKSTIFDIFCGGETLDGCQRSSNELAAFGIGAIFDYSVEGEKSEEGFDQTTNEILRTIERAGEMEYIRFSAFKVTGLASFDLLEKIHAGEKLTQEEEAAYARVFDRVDRICRLAYEKDVSVLIDAEETWIQKPIDEISQKMMSIYNREKALIYYTFQMYCHSMLDNLKSMHRQAVDSGYRLGAKLVRGAYMEKERDRAEELGYKDPIQPNKEATDRDFDLAVRYCVENIHQIGLFCGTHNEISNYKLTLVMDEFGLQKNDHRIYFSQLYGMSDHISFNLADAGYNVIKYVPYGPLKATIPYLIRRANENTSVKGQSGRELSLLRKEMSRRKLFKKQLGHQDKF